MVTHKEKHGLSIIAKCPLCQGTGKVLKNSPLGSNPRAPLTRPEKMGFTVCPSCKGSGSIGIK